MGKRAHSAPGRDATRGGSPETFPPGPGAPPPSTSTSSGAPSTSASSSSGSELTVVSILTLPALPLEPETCTKGWLCGYDDKHHPLHQDYIRRPYPEGGVTEMACRCLPEMSCGSHRNNKAQQAEVEQQHQKRLQPRLPKEGKHKYQFYWYNFKTLPPEERRDHPTPWDRRWENIFDRLDLAAKEVQYRFYTYCIVFPDRTIGDFLMASDYYLEMMMKLRHNAIRPFVQNEALRRVRHLELFIQNNPKWFDQAPGGQKVI